MESPDVLALRFDSWMKKNEISKGPNNILNLFEWFLSPNIRARIKYDDSFRAVVDVLNKKYGYKIDRSISKTDFECGATIFVLAKTFDVWLREDDLHPENISASENGAAILSRWLDNAETRKRVGTYPRLKDMVAYLETNLGHQFSRITPQAKFEKLMAADLEERNASKETHPHKGTYSEEALDMDDSSIIPPAAKGRHASGWRQILEKTPDIPEAYARFMENMEQPATQATKDKKLSEKPAEQATKDKELPEKPAEQATKDKELAEKLAGEAARDRELAEKLAEQAAKDKHDAIEAARIASADRNAAQKAASQAAAHRLAAQKAAQQKAADKNEIAQIARKIEADRKATDETERKAEQFKEKATQLCKETRKLAEEAATERFLAEEVACLAIVDRLAAEKAGRQAAADMAAMKETAVKIEADRKASEIAIRKAEELRAEALLISQKANISAQPEATDSAASKSHRRKTRKAEKVITAMPSSSISDASPFIGEEASERAARSFLDWRKDRMLKKSMGDDLLCWLADEDSRAHISTYPEVLDMCARTRNISVPPRFLFNAAIEKRKRPITGHSPRYTSAAPV